MTGYNSLLKIRRIEREIDEMGLRLGFPKYGSREQDVVSLYPKDPESFPIYTRDAELFIGTLEQAEVWIEGVKWARNYDRMIGLSNDKKRAYRENLELQRQLMEKLKGDDNERDKKIP